MTTSIPVLQTVSNGGKTTIETELPYIAEVTIEGSSPILFHRWDSDSVETKAKAAKGSKSKKSDDLGTYVYRCDNGNLSIPAEYLRMAIVAAAKFKQDPRSPRKSAMDLMKAALIPMSDLSDLNIKDWEFVDRRRVTIQKNSITRSRPGLYAGWKCTFAFEVGLPEYVPPDFLNELIQLAGRVIGIGDFRPTYGRFRVVSFGVQQ